MTKSGMMGLATLLGLAIGVNAHAGISEDVIRIGFITDMSGVYSSYDGPGGAEAIRMAIAEFHGEIDGKKIELLTADHQNKSDIAASKAREWFDRNGVDMLIVGTNSSAALAIAKVASEKKKLTFVVGAGAPALTNEQCNAYTFHYAYDTISQARGTASAVVAAGGKSWYFISADYAFGQALESDASALVKAAGGSVLGAIKHPLGASDFSSFMLQAQASNAQILGLANAGGDAVNAIKAANEFGLTRKMHIAGLSVTMPDIHALGLATTQGMYMTDSWFWNITPQARAWSQQFFARRKTMPTSFHAADYSAALQYLRAVKATGSDSPDVLIPYFKKNSLADLYLKNAVFRDDGRVVHDMYLLQVKTPAQSKEAWDYFKLLQTIPGEQAFTRKSESKCALWK
ncbi:MULTISPECIES: ABC transporter substrate-binding protein [Herbaspirillum]|jgi:branched-chain amino acid transport system substrate-binding protein|uniref:ABC transporter permease n=1 Tax=Herbaspirillum rubrisubalbicans Os34 TaxID=1235827 RepID=A0A6M3ZZ21_9BURK|nr:MULTISPECIES: ABC transporter substrate-binding protein [Herbaspirillum]MCP1574941.1 branched-chain amino acid transport system substrate-binding protein [Herbaspirillum rubrisubalbicans]NQE49639.1 ABC transporter permease [Herbaspirillum rubrisubalbicans]QJQ03463.1 ABC transporter permease [Herbaspirillum rubrisubalbicans Os34]